MNADNKILTVTEYNNTIDGGNCMKFRNADGTLKTTGYVVTNGRVYQYAKSIAKAKEIQSSVMNEEVTCGVSNIESWNN